MLHSKPSHFQSRAPRRGQALILAVLVMLFAVLLSTAFLLVIGNTGRQVGRETDRSEASRNAEKGAAFAIARLKAAANPDAWDPTNGGAELPQTTSDRQIYYSELDRAMGWDVQNYVKYPNPLTSRQAPQFLVSAHLLGSDAADDADGGDKRFMLRITVIGLSSKNPESWSRRTLYKATNWNGGTFSYANFVTAFDPDTQKLISSSLASPLKINKTDVGNPAGIDAAVYAFKGQGNERVTFSPRIADIGSTLMISGGDGVNAPVVGVVAPNAPSTPVGSIHLRILKAEFPPNATSIMLASNARVALVGSLFELPEKIDTNGSALLEDTQKQNIYGVRSDAANTDYQPFGNGSQINNGLYVPVTTTFAGRPPESRTYSGGSTLAGQNTLSSSGPVSTGDPTSVSANTLVGINFAVAVATGTPLPTPTFVPQPTPDKNQFLRIGFDKDGNTQVDTADSAVAPVIAPRTVPSAPINFAFYANKAKAANGGFGFVANSGDVEKFNGQPLTTSQLQRLWQRKSFSVANGTGNTTSGQTTSIAPGTIFNAARLCYGRPGTDSYMYPMASGSLEQRGIRGWISPWEFLPRGAQIILNGTKITIVADPVSDSSSNAPDTNKAFPPGTRQFTSFLETDPAINLAINPNLPLIIAAEGNLRPRGSWTGRPLTIVSGNNIYIEGNLTTPLVTPMAGQPYTSKIGLLAKKNVVLNPTQFVARPLGTVDTSVGKDAITKGKVGSSNFDQISFPVADATKFKLGDQVMFFSQGKASNGWHRIVNFTPDATDPTRITVFIQKPNPLDPTDMTVVLPSNFANATDVKAKIACDPPIVLIKKSDDSTTDFYEGKTAPGTTNDTRTEELLPTAANVATTGASWAYAFSKGGDTLARNMPFTLATGQGIGVAMRETVAKKNLVFTVQGGDDRNNIIPVNDDGNRNLESRTSMANPFELKLTPKSGIATNPVPNPNYDTFDLKQLTGSPDDATSNLDLLRSQLKNLSSNDSDDKANRWRLLLPAPVAPAPAGVEDMLAARRLSITSVSPALMLNPNDETPPTSIRVPLTPSAILFSGTLTTTSPDVTTPSAKPLSLIGSTFGFKQVAVDPAKETRFVKATDLAKDPAWDQPAASGTPSVVKYTQFSGSNDVAWTRDGAGDYNDQLPTYYISGWHFQKVTADMTTPTQGNSIAAATNIPKTNMNVEVDATIYAEGGSWFVIPVPTPNANGAQPADPDQQIEWRRPAYAVTINGNIAQMMTPTATFDYDDEPDADGIAMGAMKRWTDTMSYQVYNPANAAQPLWRTIRYQAAPLPVMVRDPNNMMGYIQAPLPQLPSSSDILYTYSN